MKIGIFGLGYVGTVCAACFAGRGHQVVGVDPNGVKVDLLNAGSSPIVEAGIAERVKQAVRDGRLRAVRKAEEAPDSDVSLICVGTPSRKNGDLDTGPLETVCGEIGAMLAVSKAFHVVAVRSTILPGTMKGLVIPLLEKASGRRAGVDFGVCNNPEFMREGSAVHDFNHPPRTVIGATDARSGDTLQALYEGLPGPVIRCPVEVAEMVKYADNAWHGVKVTFANEIGNICKMAGIDSHAVMDIFCQDTRLNLSPYYLKPGFAFGGSCLPKDLRALTFRARQMDVATPLLSAVLPSNQAQVERGVQMILATGKKAIGFLGFSFKAGTDDLRESPLVEVIERLIGKGCDVRLYDKNVQLAALTGANRDYILRVIPHVSRLMSNDLDAVLAHSEVVVIGNNAPEFADIAPRLKPHQQVIDFVRIQPIEEKHADYHGICW